MNLHRPEGFIGRGRGKTGWSRPQNRLEQASKQAGAGLKTDYITEELA